MDDAVKSLRIVLAADHSVRSGEVVGFEQPLKFEVCVDSIAGVRAAREAGADRVELCANLLEGGITPSLGTILVARKVADIKLHVMIRPRGGDFFYDEDEIATMEADIASAKSAGVDGVVFGVLKREGRIDRGRDRAADRAGAARYRSPSTAPST